MGPRGVRGLLLSMLLVGCGDGTRKAWHLPLGDAGAREDAGWAQDDGGNHVHPGHEDQDAGDGDGDGGGGGDGDYEPLSGALGTGMYFINVIRSADPHKIVPGLPLDSGECLIAAVEAPHSALAPLPALVLFNQADLQTDYSVAGGNAYSSAWITSKGALYYQLGTRSEVFSYSCPECSWKVGSSETQLPDLPKDKLVTPAASCGDNFFLSRDDRVFAQCDEEVVGDDGSRYTLPSALLLAMHANKIALVADGQNHLFVLDLVQNKQTPTSMAWDSDVPLKRSQVRTYADGFWVLGAADASGVPRYSITLDGTMKLDGHYPSNLAGNNAYPAVDGQLDDDGVLYTLIPMIGGGYDPTMAIVRGRLGEAVGDVVIDTASDPLLTAFAILVHRP